MNRLMKQIKAFLKYLRFSLSKRLFRILRTIVFVVGIISLVLAIFAFTSGPFWIYYWLGTSNIKPYENTEYFILLGGGGMPEESNLIRSYFAASMAKEVPDAKIIIALPGDTSDKSSSINILAHELLIKGVSPERILFETEGSNTRAQALNISKLNIPGLKEKNITVITSPEHVKRSILTFKKIGFRRSNGYPAFHRAIESDIRYENKDIGGKKYIPDVGNSISIRYRFWTHLKYEIIIMREFLALFYYKLNGWI